MYYCITAMVKWLNTALSDINTVLSSVTIRWPVPDLIYPIHGWAVVTLKSQYGIQCHSTKDAKFLFLSKKGEIRVKVKSGYYSCIDSRFIAPPILDLGTTWSWMVNFASWPLYAPIKNYQYPSNRHLHGHHSQTGCSEEKNLLPLLWIKPQNFQPAG